MHVTTSSFFRAKYRMSLRQALEKLRNDIGKGAKENYLTDVCYILHAAKFSHSISGFFVTACENVTW